MFSFFASFFQFNENNRIKLERTYNQVVTIFAEDFLSETAVFVLGVVVVSAVLVAVIVKGVGCSHPQTRELPRLSRPVRPVKRRRSVKKRSKSRRRRY